MLDLLYHCARDPLSIIYLAQCLTYSAAALAARYGQHSLSQIYASSALIHALLAIVHQIPAAP
jgi:hypothetical protein